MKFIHFTKSLWYVRITYFFSWSTATEISPCVPSSWPILTFSRFSLFLLRVWEVVNGRTENGWKLVFCVCLKELQIFEHLTPLDGLPSDDFTRRGILEDIFFNILPQILPDETLTTRRRLTEEEVKPPNLATNSEAKLQCERAMFSAINNIYQISSLIG